MSKLNMLIDPIRVPISDVPRICLRQVQYSVFLPPSVRRTQGVILRLGLVGADRHCNRLVYWLPDGSSFRLRQRCLATLGST